MRQGTCHSSFTHILILPGEQLPSIVEVKWNELCRTEKIVTENVLRVPEDDRRCAQVKLCGLFLSQAHD